MKFRPVSVPLVSVDPFFSIWSCHDNLYGGETRHWSGKACPILAGLYINGTYHSMGHFDPPDGRAAQNRIYQTGLEITPTSSIYSFENELVKATLTFTTPLLLDRPDIFARPVSYVEYHIEPKTDAEVAFIFAVSARCCVDKKGQRVEYKKTPYSLACGNVCQNPLAQSGDRVMIDWGYIHLCDPRAKVGRISPARLSRHLHEVLPINQSYDAYSEDPYMILTSYDLDGVVTLAYDEVNPIEYFYTPLKEYYTKYFSSFGEMVNAAVAEYPQIKELCRAFDRKLTDLTREKGENYERITSLAYRQAVCAHKLVEDTEGNLVFLSKENDSNGCIGTLDVTYPSIPLFLKLNPELVKGMLRPIIKYALTPEWIYSFTPHDVGQYPIANGQVYGNVRNGLNPAMQMPVEEAGNMLITLAAVKHYHNGDQSLFDENRDLMKQWADYLVEFGYDPENQLCTDDFAGHLARNCNLSLKAILGIAAYGELAGDERYTKIAADYAKRWEVDAKAIHGATRLVFGAEDGWSLKYNIVWDSLLGYELFSKDCKERETAHYLTKLNRYGVPLDSRSDYTKIDWLMWSTVISENKEYFDAVCQSIVNMLHETPDRVPMTDWYYTSTADFRRFRARSVVGGLFINLL